MSEKKKLSPDAARNLKIIAGAGVVCLLIGGAVVTASVKKNEVSAGASSIPPVREETSATGPRILPEGYAKMVDDKHIEQAEAASKSGASYVPEPTGDFKAAPTALDFPAAPASVAAEKEAANGGLSLQQPGLSTQANYAPAYTPVAGYQNGTPQATMAAYQVEKMAQYSQLVSAWGSDSAFSDSKEVRAAFKDVPASASASSAGAPARADTEKLIMQAGQDCYAEIDMAINTDEPSKVFAIARSGKIKGATLIGDAIKNINDTVSINFTTISMPGRQAASIVAIAVDPLTGRGALTGDVNHKIIERFIIPMAAAAVGKYGELVSKQGSVVVPMAGGIPGMGGQNNIALTQNLNAQQLRTASIAEGTKIATSAMAAQAAIAKPATSLPNGVGIMVRFVSDLKM